MDLQQCRDQIDRIDSQLLALFQERMEIVSEVARYKKENNMQIFHPDREEAIIQNKLDRSPDDIRPYVRPFFTHLMEYSKCKQLAIVDQAGAINHTTCNLQDTATTKVVYQGNRGAYQHIMAEKLFEQANLSAVGSFGDVFEAVLAGTADYGVLPLENSTAGEVDDVFDLLRDHQLYINLTCRLQIEHCLLTRPDVEISDVTDIYTHQQSILQSRGYLKNQSAAVHPYANNALAAEMVAASDQPFAAICAKECADIYGLVVRRQGVQDMAENFTRFIVISKALTVCPNATETTVCIRIPNKANELNKLLTKFSIYSINMNKIASRPIGDKDFSVCFYISFGGTVADLSVQNLIHDLQYHYPDFQLLGSYQVN